MNAKVMGITKEKNVINMVTDGKIEQVWDSFKYLDSIITWKKRSCREDIRGRIALGRIYFSRVRNLSVSKQIDMM